MLPQYLSEDVAVWLEEGWANMHYPAGLSPVGSWKTSLVNLRVLSFPLNLALATVLDNASGSLQWILTVLNHLPSLG